MNAGSGATYPARTLAYTKWDGSRHWSCQTLELGRDDHGLWLGLPPQTVWRRPGAVAVWDWPAVILVPDDGFVARFLDCPPSVDIEDPVAVYVDVTTTPEHEVGLVSAVDLDLDIVRFWSGTTVIEDDDEFEVHRDSMAYPPEVAQRAQAVAAQVFQAVEQGDEPFGRTSALWLAALAKAVPYSG